MGGLTARAKFMELSLVERASSQGNPAATHICFLSYVRSLHYLVRLFSCAPTAAMYTSQELHYSYTVLSLRPEL